MKTRVCLKYFMNDGSLIQRNTNTGSNNTIQEKDDKQRIKYVPQIKDGTPVLQDEVAPGNVAKKKKKKKRKKKRRKS